MMCHKCATADPCHSRSRGSTSRVGSELTAETRRQPGPTSLDRRIRLPQERASQSTRRTSVSERLSPVLYGHGQSDPLLVDDEASGAVGAHEGGVA
jgi:hypothetical protein